MRTIINLSDLNKYKHIATCFQGEQDFDSYVLEAQNMDIKAWLGGALLNEIAEQRATNTLSDANKLLMNGGEYMYMDKEYHFEGLVAAMAYYTHSRYVVLKSASVTQFGVVVKEDVNSTPASSKQVAEIKNMSYATAEAYRLEIVEFLKRNKNTYPLYANIQSKNSRRQIFKAVGE